MPDYKKKKVKKSSGSPRAAHGKLPESNAEIEMKPAAPRKKKASDVKQEANDTKLRVVRGNREKLRRRSRIAVLALIVIAAAVTVTSLLLPTGIIDQLGIWRHSISGGEFPVSMSGSNTLTTDKKSTFFFTLSDTALESYSFSGKRVLESQHGFSAPVLRTSPTRALLYDQGGKDYKLYKINGAVIEKSTQNNIIAANVSRCGAFAIAVKSANYASQVTVYDRHGGMVYEWNSSVETVMDVALSPNGKKLAVAVFNSENGRYVSKLYVLEFDSATPVFTKEYADTLVYSLQSDSNSGVYALSAGNADFIGWGKYETRQFTTDYDIRMYRGTQKLTAVVSTRQSDKKDNIITVFKNNGEQAFEVKWKSGITDLAVIGNHIAILSDTDLFLIDKNGNTVRTGEAGFGGKRIVPVSLESVIVVTDNLMSRVQLYSEK